MLLFCLVFVVIHLYLSLAVYHLFLCFLIAGSLNMRLLGDPTKGAVIEVYDGVVSGRVCPSNWNIKTARSICNHFGFTTALAATRIVSHHNSTSSPNVIRFAEDCLQDNFLPSCTTMMTKECSCSYNDIHAGVICSRGILTTYFITISKL